MGTMTDHPTLADSDLLSIIHRIHRLQNDLADDSYPIVCGIARARLQQAKDVLQTLLPPDTDLTPPVQSHMWAPNHRVPGAVHCVACRIDYDADAASEQTDCPGRSQTTGAVIGGHQPHRTGME